MSDNDKKVKKIGSVELTGEDLKRLFFEKKYLVTYSRIYMLLFNEKTGGFGSRVIYKQDTGNGGLTRRGRWHAMSYDCVCRLLGTSDIPSYI